MEQSRHAASRMAESAQDAFSDALSLLTVYDEAKASFVETTEEKVDRYEDELGTYLVKLNQEDLSSGTVTISPSCFTASEISSGFPTMRSIFWEQPGSWIRKNWPSPTRRWQS